MPGDTPTDRRIAAAQMALRAHPSSLDAHVALATVFLRRARETSKNAFRVYAQDVIDSAGAHAGDLRMRGLAVMLMLDGHRFAPAADAARQLIHDAPKEVTGHLLLGDALLELGDYGAATVAYQDALEIRPDLRSYNRAAYVRWLYGDLEGAVAIMDLALGAGSARDPESMAWCFTDLGAMYLESGDTRRALAASARALELLDGYAPALALAGRSHARADEPGAAIERLGAALMARPSTGDYLELSELLQRAGRAAEATEARATAERLAGHDPRPLAHYLARHNESPTRALTLARAELDARHGIFAHDTLALALLRAGRPQEAQVEIAAALSLGTRKADFHLHAAMIDAAMGRIRSARRERARALELDPTVDPLLVKELAQQLGEA